MRMRVRDRRPCDRNRASELLCEHSGGRGRRGDERGVRKGDGKCVRITFSLSFSSFSFPFFLIILIFISFFSPCESVCFFQSLHYHEVSYAVCLIQLLR